SAWFLTPVPRAKVLEALNDAKLFTSLTNPLPTTNTLTLLPITIPGFPPDTHPVLSTIGLNDDIRLSALQISGALLTSSTAIPFVSYNGRPTPLLAPLNGYIGGPNRGTLLDRLRLAGVLPALVSSLTGGVALRLGDFAPGDAAYACTAVQCSAAAKWVVLPNEVSGPGVYPQALDVAFRTTAAPAYTQDFWADVINQPLLLTGLSAGMCQRNAYFFNETTAEPVFRQGSVTLGPSSSGLGLGLAGKTALQGVYTGVQGFGACAQQVGFEPERCDGL
ncbi:hypothetical protein C7974DRAFT_313084, partial [Boeremia exigua]|uniref:uncharacterized protein n=1 Tax=Boeremia exigua TaxID=749465 RepID=UPI001E8D68AF